jgi:hypothetical protein
MLILPATGRPSQRTGAFPALRWGARARLARSRRSVPPTPRVITADASDGQSLGGNASYGTVEDPRSLRLAPDAHTMPPSRRIA